MADAHNISAPPLAQAETAKPRARVSAYMAADVKGAGRDWGQFEANPAVSFHQSRSWVEAWAGGTGTPICVVTVERDGQTIAILPLEIVRIGGLKLARFAGTAFSNANSGLFPAHLSDSSPAVSPRQLAAAFTQAGLDADAVLFDKMTPEDAARAPFAALPRVLHPNPSFQLPLMADFDAVLSQINAKRRRKKFRTSERRLEAAGGYRHIICEDDEQALRLLEVFLKQKSARLTSHGLPDVFADPGVRAFLARLAMTRNADGRPALELHGIELKGEHEGKIIAVSGLTRKDGHVTCQFGSIDNSIVPETSPGELLFYCMIRRASSSGDHVFDFGLGDQPYKRSWCPVRSDLVDCYIALSLKGRLAAPLIAAGLSLKRKIKTSPKLHRIAARLRALLQQRPAVLRANADKS